jgi:S1-C subfamily serine protease
LLKIQSNDDSISLNPIEVGDSENLRAGQFILALANPYGEYPSITEGIITSARSSFVGSNWGTIADNIVITDARLNPGYSGGPLVDVAGKMIGLNAAYVSSRGVAIRASKVRIVADQLAKDGAINIAYLGIVTAEISLPVEVRVRLGSAQEEGLIILSVENNTPAKKAGLLMGDIVIRLDGQPITNIHNLRRQLLKQDIIGKSINLDIIRGEKKTQLSITPGKVPRDKR